MLHVREDRPRAVLAISPGAPGASLEPSTRFLPALLTAKCCVHVMPAPRRCVHACVHDTTCIGSAEKSLGGSLLSQSGTDGAVPEGRPHSDRTPGMTFFGGGVAVLAGAGLCTAHTAHTVKHLLRREQATQWRKVVMHDTDTTKQDANCRLRECNGEKNERGH